MGHKIKSCSYKNTAARNARALQKSQEGPIFCRVAFETFFTWHHDESPPIIVTINARR